MGVWHLVIVTAKMQRSLGNPSSSMYLMILGPRPGQALWKADTHAELGSVQDIIK